MTKSKAIICDMDGTLTDCRHRRHLIDPNDPRNIIIEDGQVLKVDEDGVVIAVKHPNLQWKKNWPAFYEKMSEDTPNEWCMQLLQSWVRSVLFVTGRPERYRKVTEKWIDDNLGTSPFDRLHMRPDDDHRPACQWKRENYIANIKDKYDVIFVLEDDEKCSRMYREQGLVVLQCK